MGKNNARIYDVNSLIAAGIDPKTGLPIKYEAGLPCTLKDNIKKNLRIMDEQDAINCFTWYNLPSGLDSQLVERILFYRGQGMFFYMENLNKFFFLPYALNGSIDVYGRYTAVTPLPFNGSVSADGKEKPWIQGLVRDCMYEVELPENYIKEDGTIDTEGIINSQNTKCILIKDYSEQISQNVLSRQTLNDPILDVMAECIPFARTALINGTGVQGMRVTTEDEQVNVLAAAQATTNAALTGRKWIPVVGNVEFQDLGAGNLAKSEEYFLALQSLDNFRLSLYGLDNGGIYQKKAHMLQDEQNMNAGNVALVMRDRLQNRQKACTLINSLFGLNIWCEVSEAALGLDMNGDMIAGSNEDQGSNMGGTSNTSEEGGNENA